MQPQVLSTMLTTLKSRLVYTRILQQWSLNRHLARTMRSNKVTLTSP